MLKSFPCLLVAFALKATTGSNLVAQTSQNIRIHPNPTTYQYEPSVATHPSDPNIVLVVSVARTDGVDRLGWYYTTDGGTTWSGRDTLPTQSNLAKYVRDPVAGIDLTGTLYVNGFSGDGDVFLARSTNGGVSWTQTIIANTSGHERPHMTIDRNANSPYKNYVYAAYSDLNLAGHPVLFSRSTNQGQSFSTPVSISGGVGSSGSVGVNLAVGPDGSLYATWPGYDSPPFNPLPWHLAFNKSTDGGSSWHTARAVTTINYNGGLSKPLSFFNCPSMAVDGSIGPRRGWIYIVYTEKKPAVPDVFLVRSTDQGESWSPPTKVNQDTSGKDQWQPWISVDPSTGYLSIVYYDSRNFANNDSAEVYFSISVDGGTTFRDFLVSDHPFLPSAVWNASIAPYYMGSYIGIATLDSVVWSAWTDTRNSIHQAYTSRVVYSPSSGPKGIFSTKNMNFGILKVGSFKDTTFVITNYGNDTLKITNIVSSLAEFTVRPTSTNIPPSQSFVDTIRYTPSKPDKILATLIVSSNNLVPDTIKVSGGDPSLRVERFTSEIPTAFTLSQNYPNPFNPSTKIQFSLPQKSRVTLTVFDLLGREVATLVSEELSAGTYSTRWGARGMPSGVYLCRLRAGDFVETKKLLLLK